MTTDAATTIFAFRLSRHEIDALTDAAKKAGETVSAYVRQAIDLRTHGGLLILPTVNTVMGFPSTGSQVGEKRTWTENRAAANWEIALSRTA